MKKYFLLNMCFMASLVASTAVYGVQDHEEHNKEQKISHKLFKKEFKKLPDEVVDKVLEFFPVALWRKIPGNEEKKQFEKIENIYEKTKNIIFPILDDLKEKNSKEFNQFFFSKTRSQIEKLYHHVLPLMENQNILQNLNHVEKICFVDTLNSLTVEQINILKENNFLSSLNDCERSRLISLINQAENFTSEHMRKIKEFDVVKSHKNAWFDSYENTWRDPSSGWFDLAMLKDNGVVNLDLNMEIIEILKNVKIDPAWSHGSMATTEADVIKEIRDGYAQDLTNRYNMNPRLILDIHHGRFKENPEILVGLFGLTLEQINVMMKCPVGYHMNFCQWIEDFHHCAPWSADKLEFITKLYGNSEDEFRSKTLDEKINIFKTFGPLDESKIRFIDAMQLFDSMDRDVRQQLLDACGPLGDVERQLVNDLGILEKRYSPAPANYQISDEIINFQYARPNLDEESSWEMLRAFSEIVDQLRSGFSV
jgi:hypothetical protein